MTAPANAEKSGNPEEASKPEELVPELKEDPTPRAFLSALMSEELSAAEKSAYVQWLSKKSPTRVSNSPFVEELLAEIDNVATKKRNFWARVRYPIELPSFRVRLGGVVRMLTELIEAGEEPGQRSAGGNNTEARRRRALVSLLRQMQFKGSRALEAEMIEARKNPSMADMLKRTPEGLETPRYEVLAERGRFEVREYEEFCVASTPMGSGFSAFDSLAGYIFGKNQEEVKMAMTTPVISSPDGQKMSFIMPSKFWADTGGAPTPLAAANVTLERAGGGLLQSANTQAVMWFGGYTTKDEVARRRKALREAVAADPEWEAINGADESQLMQYNDPFVPPWRRRNEVAIGVQRRAPAAQ